MTERANEPLDAHTEEQLADAGGEFEPDFTDQAVLNDPGRPRAPTARPEDPAAEGDVVTRRRSIR